MTNKLNQTIADHIMWCESIFATISDGGRWCIPRAGLIFQKRGTSLVLVARMPWMPEMKGKITAEQLKQQQDDEYALNKRYFAAAGITLFDETIAAEHAA